MTAIEQYAMAVTPLSHFPIDRSPLWRYMTLSRFVMLLDGLAFLPSVRTLQKGDPLEGRFFLDDLWLTSALDEKFPDPSNALIEWLEHNSEKWDQAMIKANRNHPQFMAHTIARGYVEHLMSRRAVWCWFQGEDESAAMWSVYANAGIAVKTSLERLANSLPTNISFVYGGVKYVDRERPQRYLPTINPEKSDVVLRPHFIKGLEFQHEKEVRVATACHPREPGQLVSGVQSNRLIEEIVISPWLPRDERRAVRRLIERHDWKGSSPSVKESTILGEQGEQPFEVSETPDDEVVPSSLTLL